MSYLNRRFTYERRVFFRLGIIYTMFIFSSKSTNDSVIVIFNVESPELAKKKKRRHYDFAGSI